MPTFSDPVTTPGVYTEGVHSGPKAAGQPGAINGSVHVYDQQAIETINLDGANDGVLTVNGGIYAPAVHLGVKGTAGLIHMYSSDGATKTLTIDGQSGDITLFNGDIAEEFDVDAREPQIAAGTVVIVSGTDTVSGRFGPCDHRVVGVVAGAGRYRPGLVLDHRPAPGRGRRVAVSLMGKAMCRAVAYNEPIMPGDFLVTSPLPGTAMKAPERKLRRGSVFGRALGSLDNRQAGEIPVLLGHAGA